MNCSKCKRTIDDGEERKLRSEVLCDDCYINRIWPRVRKMYYANDPSEFIRRLRESYSVHPQRYH